MESFGEGIVWRVFHAPAPSNRIHKTIPNMYKAHENQKKKAYGDRVIQVEKATFIPLVFSTTGGMGIEAEALLKRLAVRMSRKTNQEKNKLVYISDIATPSALSGNGYGSICWKLPLSPFADTEEYLLGRQEI